MKTVMKISSLMFILGAIFVGCGSNNNNNNGGCANGQVNTVAGCSTGGACTVPGTGAQGGNVNGVCQAVSGVATGSCQPGYTPISSSGMSLCCPSAQPYPSQMCTQMTGGSAQCAAYGPNYTWNGVSCVPNGVGGVGGGYNPCQAYGPMYQPVQTPFGIACQYI